MRRPSPKPRRSVAKPIRLAKRLTAAMVIEAGSGYMQSKFGHYEPAELLEALDLAREWVAEQIARIDDTKEKKS